MDLAEVGANEHLENAANSLNDIRVKTEILRGDPVAEVVSYAKAYQMGLVVLSTHGKSGISAFLSGSSAQRIVNNLGCPALLLRSV